MKKALWIVGGIITGLAVFGFREKKKTSPATPQGKSIQPIIKTALRITSGFGYRTHPTTGEKLFHNGIDVGMPVGTQIFAPEDGIVNAVYYNSIGGNQLVLKHSDNRYTGYAHLKELPSLKVGSSVVAGQQIAISGNTGRTTGAHLHFTYKTNASAAKVEDRYSDPKNYLGIA